MIRREDYGRRAVTWCPVKRRVFDRERPYGGAADVHVPVCIMSTYSSWNEDVIDMTLVCILCRRPSISHIFADDFTYNYL